MNKNTMLAAIVAFETTSDFTQDEVEGMTLEDMAEVSEALERTAMMVDVMLIILSPEGQARLREHSAVVHSDICEVLDCPHGHE